VVVVADGDQAGCASWIAAPDELMTSRLPDWMTSLRQRASKPRRTLPIIVLDIDLI
jgi:hypothetical protein